MRVDVDAEFTRGFFLTEEALRKIEDLISARLGAGDNFASSIKAKRLDDAEVEYANTGELITNEENLKHQRIRRLSIESKSDITEFSLIFEKEQKTRLKINSSNRDQALLLLAELKEYLKSEVFVRRFAFLSTIASHRSTFPLAFAVPIFLLILPTIFRSRPSIDIDKATTDEKLNYLIGVSEYSRDIGLFPYVMGGMLLLVVILLIVSSDKVYPAYTFYWGRERDGYDRAKGFRSKVIWVVLVGLLIGVLSSILATGISIQSIWS
jgi:hypothetical protein